MSIKILPYISYIQNTFTKIENKKISISKVVVIYSLNNLNSHFGFFLIIFNHNIQTKRKNHQY